MSINTVTTYKLVIVESPAKCKKIEAYLNNNPADRTLNYKCMASYGHIRELSGLEAINIHDNFTPTFTDCANKKDQIAKLRKAIAGASEVILATDDDREGEAIAWHICQVFKLDLAKTKRIIFHEITESAIHRAIESTTTYVNKATVNAQLARQVLDMLVGYKLSPFLWKHVKDGLSAGRCQTPALRLIYENQKEIENRPGKEIYAVLGYFTNKNIPFELNHEETDSAKIKEFLTASIAFPHIYTGYKLRTTTKAAPLPFTTSTLQQAASNELHFSPKETMKHCQALYEAGYITYHRTDSMNYSKEFVKNAAVYICKNYGPEYLPTAPAPAPADPSAEASASASVVTAHEAIRPTDLNREAIAETCTTKEQRLYTLIRRRALESCMPPAAVSVLSANITAPLDYAYQYTTECLAFLGWKRVVNQNTTPPEYTYLQTLKANCVIPAKKIKATMQLRELKTHYSEARLVQLLEEKGIGRPSTFSSLIDKIQERNYVKKENVTGKMLTCLDFELAEGKITSNKQEREFGNEKNKLVIQPLGILALEFLLTYFETFFAYTYTKEMEDALDKISQDQMGWTELCRSCNNNLDNLSANILEKGKETIRIDDTHTYVIGKYGPVIKCTALDRLQAGLLRYRAIDTVMSKYYSRVILQVIDIVTAAEYNESHLMQLVRLIQKEDHVSAQSLQEVVPEWAPYLQPNL